MPAGLVLNVSIEQQKLSSAAVKVGVDVVLLGHGSLLSIVKEPNQAFGPGKRRHFNLPSNPCAIDVLIEAIVEEASAIAPFAVGGAEPNGAR